jgi:hypothetical protein
MRRDRSRLTGFIALVAMAVLLAAVPVHHVHMLLGALERPLVVAPADTASWQVRHGVRPTEQGPHRHAAHRSRADAYHPVARVPGLSAQKQDDRPVGKMPRCPICSTVKAAGAPPPSWSELARIDGREPVSSAAQTAPLAILHVGPLQARAPPIAA